VESVNQRSAPRQFFFTDSLIKRYGVPRIMPAGFILHWRTWSWRYQAMLH
jgi:hypothetical protein